jgi:hypothetical protein
MPAGGADGRTSPVEDPPLSHGIRAGVRPSWLSVSPQRGISRAGHCASSAAVPARRLGRKGRSAHADFGIRVLAPPGMQLRLLRDGGTMAGRRRSVGQ